MELEMRKMLDLSRLRVDGLKKPYVTLMMDIIGRSLEAASQVDKAIQQDVRRLPDGFTFDMRALPDGPSFNMKKVDDCQLKYVGPGIRDDNDVSLKFKHVSHAFLVLSFQEGTARAYANDRILVDGEVSDVMKLIRCLNRMETIILPKLIAQRAVKRYPKIPLFSKVSLGGRIYAQFVKNVFRG